MQFPVPLGSGELLGQGLAFASALAGPGGVLVAAAADGLRVDGPASQFVQQDLGLAERVVEASPVGHASGAAGKPAVDAQQAVSGELGLLAVLAVAMRAT